MGKINSREKGARYEIHVAKRIREYGFKAERGCQHAGGKDSPDVKTNMKFIHLECKKVEKLNIWNALHQSKRDAGEDENPAVVFSRNREDDYFAVPFDFFMQMYIAWLKEKERERSRANESIAKTTE